MAFIKLRDIPSSVRRDMVRKAGYREETNMLNARWISTTKDGDLIRFTRSNPNFRKNKYETTKTAGSLNKLPNWIFRLFMRIARFLDRHNCLPKSLIKASPFHTSVFVTNLKSLKLDAIHHHLYEFGTCSLFIAMGKEKMTPVVEGNKENNDFSNLSILEHVNFYIENGYEVMEAIKLVAKERHIPKSEVYNIYHK